MATARPDEATIRERAYHIWEDEGRPDGRDTEFWMRAEAASTDASQLKMLTETPPDKAKTKSKAANAVAGKAKVTSAKTKKK
jgi:hypothetical protein